MSRLAQYVLMAVMLLGSALISTAAQAQRTGPPDSLRADSVRVDTTRVDTMRIDTVQVDTMEADSLVRYPRIRAPVWGTPSRAGTIYGLSVGPILTPGSAWGGTTQRINGIAVNLIGVGLLAPLFPMHPIEHPFFGRGQGESTRDHGPVVNGLLVSGAGPFVKRVNGVSGAFIATIAGDARGLLVGGLLTAVKGRFVGITGGLMNNALEGDGLMVGAWTGVVDLQGVQVGAVNSSVHTRGLQLGLYNFSRDLHGVQLGLLNRTPDRALPLVNWRF